MTAEAWSALWVSLRTSLIATVWVVAVGIPFAAYMARVPRARRGFWWTSLDLACLVPIVLPPTVIGFGLLALFGARSPVGRLLISLGGQSIAFTPLAAVLAAAIVAFPLLYRAARAAFEQVDARLFDVARTLGASEARIYWRIAGPEAASGLIAGTLLAFARAFGEFGASLMFAGNIPGVTQTLPMSIFFAVEAGDMQLAAVWSVVMLLASCSVLFLGEYLVRREARRKSTRREAMSTEASTPVAVASLACSPSASGTPSVRLHLRKKLAGFELAVDHDSSARRIAIIGDSGAGKSTLLASLAGIVKPDQGRIEIGGRVLFDAEEKIHVAASQRAVSLAFQDAALFPRMSNWENVAFGVRAGGAEERKQKALEGLRRVGLERYAHGFPGQLSGGQKQRVALARALAAEPAILLLDEPFAALDVRARSSLRAMLRETLASWDGVMIFVTHDIDEARAVADEIMVLEEGKVVGGGSAHALVYP